MTIRSYKTDLPAILKFRHLFLQENNFQIRYNACHERNWSDSYLLEADGVEVGYGSIKGKDSLTARDAAFEFYVLPEYRRYADQFFFAFLQASAAKYIECQSNDLVLSGLCYEFATGIHADVILFEADWQQEMHLPGIIFRLREEGDRTYHDKPEDAGEFVLEKAGEIVATGGFLRHYNVPFADLYMDVREDCRRQGLGSYIIQELIRECYRAGRVPAARCNMTNKASRATLLKGGLRICGFMLNGEVKIS